MTKASLHSPLSDTELDRLGTFLTDLGSLGMPLEMLDGYLTALICGPDMVPPSEFLPEIWGEEFEFSSPDQAADMIGLIMRHWNTIADEFREAPHVYMPVLEKDENGMPRGNDWARGFMRGMHMRHGSWSELVNSKDYGGPLVPIMILAYENDPDPALRSPPITDDKREDILAMTIAGAAKIYRYFTARRRSLSHLQRGSSPFAKHTKIGRNEPCPCGSGLKFKRCCGAVAPILH